MCIRFDTIPECDGQTDGQTDGFVITISRSACIGMLSRDKKHRQHAAAHTAHIVGVKNFLILHCTEA